MREACDAILDARGVLDAIEASFSEIHATVYEGSKISIETTADGTM